MTGIVGAVDRYWFAEGTAGRLAVLRIAVGTGVLVYLYSRFGLFISISGTATEFFVPAGPITLLPHPVAPSTFRLVLIGTMVANVAFIVGRWFRVAGPLFAVALLLVLSYRNSWSMVHHFDNLVVLHVLILGFTRSADALSLDAVGRGRRPARGWEYGYPVRLLCTVTVVTYVLAGIAKVAGPLGWHWALGEGLRGQVAVDALRKELLEGGSQWLAYVVWDNIALSTALGVGALVLELGAPVALLDSPFRRVWAVATFGMHWGIYAVMGIAFWYHLVGLALLPFVAEEGVTRWGRQCVVAWTSSVRTWSRNVGAAPRRPAHVPGPEDDAGEDETLATQT